MRVLMTSEPIRRSKWNNCSRKKNIVRVFELTVSGRGCLPLPFVRWCLVLREESVTLLISHIGPVDCFGKVTYVTVRGRDGAALLRKCSRLSEG